MTCIRIWLLALVAIVGLLLCRSAAALAETDDGPQLTQRLDRLEAQVHQLSAQRDGPGAAPWMEAPQPPGAPAAAGMDWHHWPPSAHRGMRGPLCLALLCLIVVIHILLAVWVFSDIRGRGQGHGIFIVLALLAGILGALLYAVVRIGDRVAEKKS